MIYFEQAGNWPSVMDCNLSPIVRHLYSLDKVLKLDGRVSHVLNSMKTLRYASFQYDTTIPTDISSIMYWTWDEKRILIVYKKYSVETIAIMNNNQQA